MKHFYVAKNIISKLGKAVTLYKVSKTNKSQIKMANNS